MTSESADMAAAFGKHMAILWATLYRNGTVSAQDVQKAMSTITGMPDDGVDGKMSRVIAETILQFVLDTRPNRP